MKVIKKTHRFQCEKGGNSRKKESQHNKRRKKGRGKYRPSLRKALKPMREKSFAHRGKEDLRNV